MSTKECKNCFKEFTPRVAVQIFCKRVCAVAAALTRKAALNDKKNWSITIIDEDGYRKKFRPCMDCGIDIINRGSKMRCKECGPKKRKADKKLYRDSNPLKKIKLQNKTTPCTQCTWAEGKCDIHHINGRKIPDPHNPTNLTVVCPNCHRLVHEDKIPPQDLIPIKIAQ